MEFVLVFAAIAAVVAGGYFLAKRIKAGRGSPRELPTKDE